MNRFEDFLIKNIYGGRISEIIDIAEKFFDKKAGDLHPEIKADILCSVMCITREDLDSVIANHSEVSRTIKGHAFEVVFDAMMAINDINCIEVGGDTDIDRIINDYSLQLKTPFVNGCSEGIVSYKTHKTHGAKSQSESVDYYHKVEDFADFLIGLVSYEPFTVLIVPKESLPRVSDHSNHIQSPMYLNIDNPAINNNFKQLDITRKMYFPTNLLSPTNNECLPISSELLHLKSDYILRAIFIKDNFRIWDMNMRGFIREHILLKHLAAHRIKAYSPAITELERSDKCDLVLKNPNNNYVRFQVKGLTWNGTNLDGINTAIDCESQLSRGRVNDHPTQSRLYKVTDFENLIIAIDPPYSNTLSIHTYKKYDYHWNFYCIPMSKLRKHHVYTNRVASHQYITYKELQKYRIDSSWMDQWMPEL